MAELVLRQLEVHLARLPRPTRNELVLPQVESQLDPRPCCRLELGRVHVEGGTCGRSFAGAAFARGRDRLKLHELIPQTQEGKGKGKRRASCQIAGRIVDEDYF